MLMRSVDSFFQDQIDSSLYHYTGIKALLGIAESKSIWASNIYYLNDSKEIIHACDLLEAAIEPWLAFGNNINQEILFLSQFKDWVKDFRRSTFNIFVFSLSQKPSLLSQWRAYTPHGKGVSIGISASSLTSIAQKNNLRIAKCLYQKHEHQEIIDSLLEKLLTTFRQRLPTIDTTKNHPSQCFHSFLEDFRGDILQILSIIKHPAFEEECEWRLISPYYPKDTAPDIRFREGASMLLPYIELSLGDTSPTFESVWLGPSANSYLAMSALSMFLSNQRLCNELINSQIPYRQWT